MATPLLSSVTFASFLVYAPQAAGELAERSRRVRDQVKNARGGIIELAAQRIQERWDTLGFAGFLGSNVLLIPAPRSSPLSNPRALWPPYRIAEALARQGLGEAVVPLLERTRAVPKSAFATPGTRPAAMDHLASIIADSPLALPQHSAITVVDDFITTGSTLLATASHLQAAFPDTTVRCFALVRTLSGEPVEMSELATPCTGTITYYSDSGRTTRRP